MNIAIKINETKIYKNGNRIGDWYIRQGNWEWHGTWKATNDNDTIVVMGDPIQEAPITEDALETLIYCTQEV